MTKNGQPTLPPDGMGVNSSLSQDEKDQLNDHFLFVGQRVFCAHTWEYLGAIVLKTKNGRFITDSNCSLTNVDLEDGLIVVGQRRFPF